MTTPDVIGETIAFRAWKAAEESDEYDDDGHPVPVLYSLNDEEWPADEWMVAECGRRGHEPPGENCSCGIYAARDPKHLTKLKYNRGANIVVGEVGLAGLIVPGELGFRAARARVVRLWVPYDRWELGNKLAARYDVPVLLANTLKAIKREAEVSGHRD